LDHVSFTSAHFRTELTARLDEAATLKQELQARETEVAVLKQKLRQIFVLANDSK
jgi:hypothetical protein